jgi:hypothetical protein
MSQRTQQVQKAQKPQKPQKPQGTQKPQAAQRGQAKQKTEVLNFNDLPNEIILEILDNLPPSDFLNAMKNSKVYRVVNTYHNSLIESIISKNRNMATIIPILKRLYAIKLTHMGYPDHIISRVLKNFSAGLNVEIVKLLEIGYKPENVISIATLFKQISGWNIFNTEMELSAYALKRKFNRFISTDSTLRKFNLKNLAHYKERLITILMNNVSKQDMLTDAITRVPTYLYDVVDDFLNVIEGTPLNLNYIFTVFLDKNDLLGL